MRRAEDLNRGQTRREDIVGAAVTPPIDVDLNHSAEELNVDHGVSHSTVTSTSSEPVTV